MSQYLCPECGTDSGVVDTRPSYNRLRRRRICRQKHKFSTVEVPIDAPEQVTSTLEFGIRNIIGENDPEMIEDMIAYLKSQVRETLLGLNEQETP